MSTVDVPLKNKRLPLRGWIGIVLIIIFWYINWQVEGLRTHYGFFPLWLGYCLVVDAITCMRKGNSLISRSVKGFFFLFSLSIPGWWLFEFINDKAHYWHYTERDHFSDLEYFLYASLSFSTVIPAVFSTSELVGTFSIFQKPITGPQVGKSRASIISMFVLGILMLAGVFLYPEYSAAFLWMSIYFILDPINHYLGNRTLIQGTARHNWSEVIILWVGCLICGFFWEMWNYHSSPKWYYTVPYVNFWHVFEMPLVGYLGYLPFALELFALYHLLIGLFGESRWQKYLQLIPVI